MTDKQIIIEDCPHFIGGCCQEYLDGVCENHKCDLKIIRELEQQLKRKEQECEELKAKCKKYGEINEQETKDYAELKAENEELKVQNIKYMNGNIGYQLKNSLYKQTLTEIKEMLKEICMEECSFDWNKTSKKHCGDCDCRYGQILQKISECEE